ncbi:MAG: hypothetical protein AAF702_21395 [Chloroflexota bacterium]
MNYNEGATIQEDDEETFSEAVEQFLSGEITSNLSKMTSIFLIGDDQAYLSNLKVELSFWPNHQIKGQSRTVIEEVLTALNQQSPDIILFDVGLSMTHHLRTIQLIRTTCPSTKLLALMPDAIPLHIRQVQWSGVHGYILKDSPTVEIINKVAEIQEFRKYMLSALT